MASDQLWGSLVKAMTRKIEVPKIGQGPSIEPISPYRKPPEPISDEPVAPPADLRSKSGRRKSDPNLEETTEATSTQSRSPSVTSPAGCIERVVSQLGYLTSEQVQSYLEHHGGGTGVLAARLQALGLLPAGTQPTGPDFWWKAVSEGWVTPELLAEILRSAPGIPERRDSLLFEFILDQDVAPYRDVKAAAQRALAEGVRLLHILVDEGSISQARSADITAEFYGLRRRRGRKWKPDPDQAGTVSSDFAEAFGVVPLRGDDSYRGLTLLVTSDPGPIVRETLMKITGREVQLLVDTQDKWSETLTDWQEATAAAQVQRARARGRLGAHSASGRTITTQREVFRFDQDSFAGISYVPEMVQAIMQRATAVGATDIHLEPQENRMRVRFRLDGILHDVANLRINMGEDTISRIKVMADMDITERRKPQDGHVHQDLGGNPFDFRIATVPTSRGERMGIRITAASKEVPKLAILGLNEDEERQLQDFTRRSHGIVLACGPVGSGKTTTLYASLGELDATQRNIMSIEDPVEIELPDVSQVNVNYKLGMDFSSGLRALLRQDPNIILVGEVRDDETAKVAVRGSLTGLLVFSSIHANSAPGAITTLYNFDIPPFLLATSLVGVIAQRLVRTICPDCREQYSPDPGLLAQAGLPPVAKGKKKEATPNYFHGRGCDGCYGTGYRGRTGIFEILDINEEMRHGISERAPEASLRQMGIAAGMQTLSERGRARVLDGQTSVEEFIRVLYQ